MRALKNTWYMAAWDNEVQPERLFERVLLEKHILFFRDSQGTARALGDRCPHRFAPLHLGVHCGDSVQCKYHGLEFGIDGRCVRNPHGNGVIPQAANVPAYPTVESYGAIWIWLGDPKLADPATVPVFPLLDPDVYAVGHGYLKARANYQLEADNILDLSHIEFMHPLFATEAVRRGKTESSQDGNIVWSKRLITNDHLPPFLAHVVVGSVVDVGVRCRVEAYWQVRSAGVTIQPLSLAASGTDETRRGAVRADRGRGTCLGPAPGVPAGSRSSATSWGGRQPGPAAGVAAGDRAGVELPRQAAAFAPGAAAAAECPVAQLPWLRRPSTTPTTPTTRITSSAMGRKMRGRPGVRRAPGRRGARATGRLARIRFSSGGSPSAAVSRVKMPSIPARRGSAAARSLLISSRACCSSGCKIIVSSLRCRTRRTAAGGHRGCRSSAARVGRVQTWPPPCPS